MNEKYSPMEKPGLKSKRISQEAKKDLFSVQKTPADKFKKKREEILEEQREKRLDFLFKSLTQTLTLKSQTDRLFPKKAFNHDGYNMAYNWTAREIDISLLKGEKVNHKIRIKLKNDSKILLFFESGSQKIVLTADSIIQLDSVFGKAHLLLECAKIAPDFAARLDRFIDKYKKSFAKYPLNNFLLNTILNSPVIQKNLDQVFSSKAKYLVEHYKIHPIKNFQSIIDLISQDQKLFKELKHRNNQYKFQQLRKIFPKNTPFNRDSFLTLAHYTRHELEKSAVPGNFETNELLALKVFINRFCKTAGFDFKKVKTWHIVNLIKHARLWKKPDSISKIQNLIDKGYVKKDPNLFDYSYNVLYFVDSPQHEQFLALWKKSGFKFGIDEFDFQKKFHPEKLLYLSRIAHHANILEALRDQHFIKFCRRINSTFGVEDDELLNLHLLYKLFKSLPRNIRGERDSSYIFSPEFRKILKKHSHEHLISNYQFILFNYQYSKMDQKKIEYIKKQIKHKTYPGDLFLLDAIAKNLSLQNLIKPENRNKLEFLAKPLGKPVCRMDNPSYKTERPSLSGLRTLTLVRIHLIKESMKNSQFRKTLFNLVNTDLRDATREIGGFAVWDQKKQRLDLLDVVSKLGWDIMYMTGNTGKLIPGITTTHNHAILLDSSRNAGPSGEYEGKFKGDFEGANKRTDLVFTSVGRTAQGKGLRVNVDLYYVDDTVRPPRTVVVDVGTFDTP